MPCNDGSDLWRLCICADSIVTMVLTIAAACDKYTVHLANCCPCDIRYPAEHRTLLNLGWDRMDNTTLIAAWENEQRQPFVGWDFSYLHGRMASEELPWSYETRAIELMHNAQSALDLDTGGGERLLQLRSHWPARLVATESYQPNVQLATERLTPLGVQVVDAAADERVPLPFGDASFDLILNRHGGLNIAELARVLKPGGTLFTQQVHGQTLHDLLELFGATPQWPDATPEAYIPMLEQAGLVLIEQRQHWGAETFNDVGALVYFLRAIPWLVPGFSLATHSAPLYALHERVAHGDVLRFAAGAYLIEARKPDEYDSKPI